MAYLSPNRKKVFILVAEAAYSFNLRKIFICLFLFPLVFSACKKAVNTTVSNNVLGQAEVAELNKQSGQLTQSEFGWKAYLYPSNGGGYAFYMNFDTANKVTMYADLDYKPASISMESTYQINKAEIPSLFFATYNYMHVLATAQPATFGGIAGWVVYSDFEFNFAGQSGDTLKLNGKLLDSKLVLVKATAAERDAYMNKGLYNSILSSVNYINHHSSLYINLGDGTKIQTAFNYLTKVFSLAWEERGIIHTYSSAFVFTLDGILLQSPLVYKDKIIRQFTWDAANGVFFIIADGQRIEVLVAQTPVMPLHVLLGNGYSTITVPKATVYPGWSSDFQVRRKAAASAMLASTYWLRLERMVITFNTLSRVMGVKMEIYQDATLFLASFNYNYVKTAAGVYKFTPITPTGNAALIVKEIAPLTTQRLNTDSFTLSYVINPSTGQLLGQFSSIEHADFTFSGILQ